MITLPKKVVLLDLDNTLTDTEGNSRRAMNMMYDELELSKQFPPFIIFWGVYHDCNEELWSEYRRGEITRDLLNERRFTWPLELMGVNNLELAQHINEVFYKHFLPQDGVMPGTYELLEYLHSKYRLAIVSNGTKSSQLVKMKVFKFEPYFEKMFLSDDIGFPKPDVRIYEHVLREMGVTAEDAIMIGDDFDGDVVGAANAGLEQVWYNPTNQKKTSDFEPTLMVDNLLSLKKYL
ncbi:MAG: YjjG family noncanonical pyrimidine nucleotidase [Paludibacteraceae bacterium]|nr:YjjG family noncanonical pyrimidine nucleotidase [Paludibacteraceae bacterium]